MARRKRPDGRSRWRSQTSGRRFPPRAFTDQLRAPRGLGHLDNFINASDYRAGRRPRREINQFPRLVIRFRGTKRTSNENDAEQRRSWKGGERNSLSSRTNYLARGRCSCSIADTEEEEREKNATRMKGKKKRNERRRKEEKGQGEEEKEAHSRRRVDPSRGLVRYVTGRGKRGYRRWDGKAGQKGETESRTSLLDLVLATNKLSIVRRNTRKSPFDVPSPGPPFVEFRMYTKRPGDRTTDHRRIDGVVDEKGKRNASLIGIRA